MSETMTTREQDGYPSWSLRERYPPGVPCWIEALQPDVQEALGFYGVLFGWEFAGPFPMAGGSAGEYFVAQVAGHDVAAIGPAPKGQTAGGWFTHIRVDRVEAAVAAATEAGGRLLDGPLDDLPAGRFARLADDTGAQFGVWEAHAREGARLINHPQAWDMSSLRTSDVDGSTAFYRSLFGWLAEPFGGPGSGVTLWRVPGYVGGQPHQPAPRDVVAVMTTLGGPSSAGRKHSHWSVDFYVDDANAMADGAERLGGKVIVAPYDNPGFRSAVIADPGGATFSISQEIADSEVSEGARHAADEKHNDA